MSLDFASVAAHGYARQKQDEGDGSEGDEGKEEEASEDAYQVEEEEGERKTTEAGIKWSWVARDRKSKAVVARSTSTARPSHPYARQALLKDLECWGHGPVTLRSGGEHALKQLKRQPQGVGGARRERTGLDTTTVGDHPRQVEKRWWQSNR